MTDQAQCDDTLSDDLSQGESRAKKQDHNAESDGVASCCAAALASTALGYYIRMPDSRHRRIRGAPSEITIIA
jgi:hypothetical protein